MDDFADFAQGDTDKVREHIYYRERILQRTHSTENTFYTMDDFADFAEGDTDKVREHIYYRERILQRTHSTENTFYREYILHHG